MRGLTAAVVVLGLAGLIGPALAAPVPGPSDSSAAGSAGLDLSIRARSLGLVPGPSDGTNLGVETIRAPSGAGQDRMAPARQEVAPGVFLYVDPNCLPGEEPFFPRRPVPLRRR